MGLPQITFLKGVMLKITVFRITPLRLYKITSRVLTTVVVVAGGTQLSPSDRVQVLFEATVPGKDLRQSKGNGPVCRPVYSKMTG